MTNQDCGDTQTVWELAGALCQAETDSPAANPTQKPKPRRPKRLPVWNVLLHNDDVNEAGYVVETIIELTTLQPRDAMMRMLEAHKTGLSCVIQTHREHAELLMEQFGSKGLTVTIEPLD